MADCTCSQLIADRLAAPDVTLAAQIKKTGEYVDETLHGKTQKVESGEGGATDDPGQHGRLDRIRFCHWAAPEYGGVGESLWTKAFQAAQLAISALNALIQGQISDLQQDLAEGYYQQAKYKWDRFSAKYQPLEKSILWEASNTPIREMDCTDDRARAVGAVNPSFDYIGDYMGGIAKGYRLCMDSTMVRQLEYSRNLLLVDTENYNLRDDQWFTDFKNDQRWNRRSNILNLGRNLGAQALQYGDVARKLAGSVSDIANRAFGSISQALGYYGTRFDTFYPTSYLAGNSSSTLVTTSYKGTSYTPEGGASATI